MSIHSSSNERYSAGQQPYRNKSQAEGRTRTHAFARTSFQRLLEATARHVAKLEQAFHRFDENGLGLTFAEFKELANHLTCAGGGEPMDDRDKLKLFEKIRSSDTTDSDEDEDEINDPKVFALGAIASSTALAFPQSCCDYWAPELFCP